MTTPEEKEVLKYFANVKPREEDKSALWMGVGFLLIGSCVPAYQAVLWLQTGHWTPLPISYGIQFLGWHVPSTTWVGAQKIIDWLFDLPLWSIPGFMAFGCFSAWKETT
ncbi:MULTISPECIES: hypothetical protein [unclassified Bradyrhizobium]|uniref:hypothetical protein n=1 Tax=unclassified Bradyrhizobium TaxID=2631580 RepID=UPI001BA8A244|nr:MULTISPECIES: hypothetical protein [unclassified Bradyrhizobium]MBR1204475.1 hypothetical protein [Bradyrhizobium sp. AUGA SZCCT0124]MBR1309639.1 hypothetical protein [Bradyrhizobium sp. AUGA SZCCT0051]MBR1339780.1 hypothetical protein [Bradyrhizobium sp. AUGA SZCCT0105]MBR1354387.1 hypothetical protein [Bradyrhizobium sp. AUGA SZCCT0045]